MTSQAAEEDAALDRLLAQPGASGTLAAYGAEPDQVWEEFGSATGATLVFVHGGYYRPQIDRTHARPAAAALAAAGYHVVLAEYRRIPGVPLAAVDDLRAVERVLVQRGARPQLWIGHSAGGQLVQQRAYDLATVPTPTVALAPVGDLRRSDEQGASEHAVRGWIGCPPEQAPELWDALDPNVLVTPERDRSVRVLHGSRDASVDIDLNRRYNLTVLGGAHHIDLIDPQSRYWPQVLQAASAARTAATTATRTSAATGTSTG